MKAKSYYISILTLITLLTFSCKKNDKGTAEYVPDVEVGSVIEFTPTEGGSVEWFKYYYTSNGVDACNNESNTFFIDSWEYDRISETRIYVKTTMNSGSFEEVYMDGYGEYEYTGVTHYGYSESHKGVYEFVDENCLGQSGSKGTLMAWTSIAEASSFNTLYINGESYAGVSNTHNVEPNCTDNDVRTIELDPGTYTVLSKSGLAIFQDTQYGPFEVTIVAGQCTKLKIQ